VDEDKVAELGEHLQTAALELIAAARVVLDLAEEVVKEPGGTMALIQHLGPKPARPADGPASPRVQRIRVS
jgi:hypothetical protein